METTPPQDPLAREQARRRRAQKVQRRRVVLGAFVVLVVLIVVLAIGLSGDGGTAVSTTSTESTETSLAAATYAAELTGADSVPTVKTASTGTLTLTYDPDAATLTFVLDINGLTDTSVATIYEGTPGTSGTAVLTLFDGPTVTGVLRGELAAGSVEATSLTGTLTGATVGDLIALIEEGNAYVSVGNSSHPIDAIRGQIR